MANLKNRQNATKGRVLYGTLLAIVGVFEMLVVPPAAGDIATVTQTIQLSLAPATKLSVPSSLALTSIGGAFNAYTGTLILSYKSRTTPGGSGATITMKANSEFTPAGGPTLASSALTYICSAASLGTGCSGTQTVSATAQTAVVSIPAGKCTGGGGLCSPSNPNTVSLNMQLANTPVYQTGNYSTVVVFTVSSI